MDSLLVQDYMDRQAVLLTVDLSIDSAVAKLVKHRKTGAPVVDSKGKLVGFLSEQDCLSVMLKSTYHCDLVAKVSDCMRTDVLAVSPNDRLVQLAEQMLGPKPKVYPVVADNKVIATIDRTNILKAIGEQMKLSYLSQI